MDSLKKLSETVDSNLKSLREGFHEILTGMVSKENQLNALQESVTERSKEVDMIRESVEERLNEVEKKEEELKKVVLIREDGLKDLELRKKEIEVREEKLTAQENFMQKAFKSMELERRKFEDIQKSIDGKFAEISQKERVLVEKFERDNQERELKENIFSSREAELDAKEKELEGREKVLALRNDQIVFREKQLELRNVILNLKAPEKNGSMVLANIGNGDFGLLNATPLLLKSEDLIRGRDTFIPVTEAIVPPEGKLPMRNTDENQVETDQVSEEKELEAKEDDQLGTKVKEFESTRGKEKSLTRVVAQGEEGGLREKVLPSRNGLIIPKEKQLDGTVGLTAYEEGNSRKPNAATAHIEESRNSTQKTKKRGRPPTKEVELRILYKKTEEIDGNIDSADGVKGKPGFPNVDAADRKGQTLDSKTNSNKRVRTRKTK